MKNEPLYDFIIKLVIIGNSGVGKTAIFNRYSKEKFDPSTNNTIGTDLFIKNLNNDNKNISLQIWDTAGQEK